MVLLKIKGKIVGRTVVQDYVFRPSELSHVSLYDWIRLSDIQKCSVEEMHDTIVENGLDHSSDFEDDDQERIYYRFQKDHPLYHSHHVALVSDAEEWVPNFVGGAIPRSDRGDREYYCSAMLTLFKPWRSGKDLRSKQQSWDDAFISHQFNLRQSEIMKYFNVRYECLDARDDFAAQMKKGENIGIFSNWDVYENLQTDMSPQSLQEGDAFDCSEDPINDDNIIGPTTNKRNKDMAKVEEIMHTAGWFDDSPDGPAEVGDLTPIIPTKIQSGNEWKTVVQNKRQEVLEERSKNLPAYRDEFQSSHTFQKSTEDVRIVDKAFLSSKFQAKIETEQNHIDATVTEYLLNSEQERAF
jgi:hypothetical protein